MEAAAPPARAPDRPSAGPGGALVRLLRERAVTYAETGLNPDLLDELHSAMHWSGRIAAAATP